MSVLSDCPPHAGTREAKEVMREKDASPRKMVSSVGGGGGGGGNLGGYGGGSRSSSPHLTGGTAPQGGSYGGGPCGGAFGGGSRSSSPHQGSVYPQAASPQEGAAPGSASSSTELVPFDLTVKGRMSPASRPPGYDK